MVVMGIVCIVTPNYPVVGNLIRPKPHNGVEPLPPHVSVVPVVFGERYTTKGCIIGVHFGVSVIIAKARIFQGTNAVDSSF